MAHRARARRLGADGPAAYRLSPPAARAGPADLLVSVPRSSGLPRAERQLGPRLTDDQAA